MKIYLLSLIPFLCGFVGYLFSVKKNQRKNFFTGLKKLNENLINEINFSQNTIPQILSYDTEINRTDTVRYVYELINGENEKRLYYLDKEETDLVKQYVANLGKTDKKGQITMLRSYESKFNEYADKAEKENKRAKSLYIKVCFIFGLIIFILMV